MKRRFIAGFLLIVLALSTLGGCAAPILGRPKLLPMNWDGSALVGATFHERHFPLLTVHYADPTRPSDVERLGAMLQEFLVRYRAFGRFAQGDRLDVWVVPGGYAWPEQLWIDNLKRSVQAVKPRVVVVKNGFLPWELARDERLLTDRVRQWEENADAIYRAVVTAVTQGPGSAAYRIGWIQDGMGGLFVRDYALFPAAYVTTNFSGSFNQRMRSWQGESIVYALDRSVPQRYQAAAALAALMVAQYGVDWPVEQTVPGKPFTPYMALRNLAKLANPKVSNPRSVYREAESLLFYPLYRSVQLGDKANRLEPIAEVDKGADRIQPPTSVMSANVPNLSPLSYHFDVRWEPATHTIAGEEQITWTNGEGVPVDRLYFNVWGNALRAQWYGGQTSVDAVSVEGQPVAYTFRGMDLEVPLGRSVGAGETVRLTIRLATRPATVRTGNANQPKPWEPPTENWSLQLWYPALAVLNQEGWQLDSFPENGQISAEPADYTVRITVPPGTRVEAGAPGKQTPADDGATVFEYEAKGVREWTGQVIIALESEK